MRKFRSALSALLLVVGVIALQPVRADAQVTTQASISLMRNDYNRDGVSDLVGIRLSDGCLARWRGTGDGGFAYIGDVGCGWNAYDQLTAVGDFNRDGNGDLVAVRRSDGCLARWRGTGSFGFVYIGDYGCGWNAYYALGGAGDINGDGIGDLVAVRGSDNCLARWLGNGNGGFTYIGDYGCTWYYELDFTGVGDVNRDGRADLLATYWNPPCFRTFAGDGASTFHFIAEYCYLLNPDAQVVGMGDINRDGNGDFVTINSWGCLERWLSDGYGNWFDTGEVGCGWSSYWIA
jgi:hypothetical protein